MRKLFLLSLLSILFINTFAQNCACTYTEVANNTVQSCNITIGKIVRVNSAQAFRQAIWDANANGGNVTILIADGTYLVATPDSYPYITASNMVIRSESGKRDAVILTGTGMKKVSPKVENGLFAVGDNITIADLTVKDVGNHGIAITGNDVSIYNVKVQNTYEQMIKGNRVSGGTHNGKIKCSLLEYTANYGPQFYIGGIDIHEGHDWSVSDNIFKNIASPSEVVAEHAIHFWRQGTNITTERNKIINCDRGIGYGLGNSADNNVDGGLIANNMIYNDGTRVFNDAGIILEASPNIKVYNNTVYQEDYYYAFEYRFPLTKNVIFTNNLTNKSFNDRDGATGTLITNEDFAKADWFEDVKNANLKLNTDNEEVIEYVINIGTDVSEVSDDIYKYARTKGTYDIGAHEYTGSLSIKDVIFEQGILLSPNPATDAVSIQLTDETLKQVIIYNHLGQEIVQYNTENINLSKLKNGIYFLKIISKNGKVGIKKVVKN